MKKATKMICLLSILIIGLALIVGSAPSIRKPHELTAPPAILGNMGKYMCPYTQDGVMAEWTDKAISAKMGAAIGKHAGAYVGKKVLENIPFIGGILGSKAGEAMGREIAIKSAGGWEYITKTSDLSFNNLDDLSVYLYVKHSNHEHYRKALEATMEIYPNLKKRYYQALQRASK